MRQPPKQRQRHPKRRQHTESPKKFSVPSFTFDVAGHRVKTVKGKKGNFKIHVKGQDTDISLNAKKFGGIIKLFHHFQKAFHQLSESTPEKGKKK